MEFFLSPKVALLIFLGFLIIYIVLLDTQGAFQTKLWHFGPGTTPENTAYFMGIAMDTWPKVLVLYAISFITALVTSYYSSAIGENLHTYIWNVAVPHVPYSKFWTYLIVILEPFLYQLLALLEIATYFTCQLQFFVPSFFGRMLASLPFDLARLATKTFASW